MILVSHFHIKYLKKFEFIFGQRTEELCFPSLRGFIFYIVHSWPNIKCGLFLVSFGCPIELCVFVPVVCSIGHFSYGTYFEENILLHLWLYLIHSLTSFSTGLFVYPSESPWILKICFGGFYISFGIIFLLLL